MRKLLLVSFLMMTFGLATEMNAQNYSSAVGLRLGYTNAASYKKFISESNAFEVYATFDRNFSVNTIGLNAAYLIHNDILLDGLTWYFGGGGYAAISTYDGGSSTGYGLSGYLGLEFTFPGLPVSISTDWVPSYSLNSGGGFGGRNGGLAVRYVLGE